MPYRNAPYFILVCIGVIIAGFWESYFSVWGHVPWQFHAHGVAASIWVLMVLAPVDSIFWVRTSCRLPRGSDTVLV